ncbi:MAG: ABC transporter ATP-binding protein [Candidatus Micrarchaeales archaeon]
MGDIIKIESLVKKFGDFTAVSNISLNIKEGEIFGLLGPNGAGKTTTINMLLTLLIPTSGRITVDGMDVVKNHEKVKQLMGLMTQETVVEAELTARQNLELFSSLYHVPANQVQKRINMALEEADLMKFADIKAGTFSGGMQRRLGLVKAMIQEPKILVLDEPTTGLDVQNRSTMWTRIRQLNKEGATVLLTTQYLEEADTLCDRLGIIDHGKLIALGTPSEIKRIAGSGKILEITVKNEDVQKTVAMLKAKFKITAIANGEKVIATLDKDSEMEFTRISSTLDKEKIGIISIGMHLPTLDDVFIKLTGSGMRDAAGAMKGGRMDMKGWK